MTRPALMAALLALATTACGTPATRASAASDDPQRPSSEHEPDRTVGEGATAVNLTPPWSISYHDGNANGYRLWQDAEVAQYEYTPVTPAMSSSGTYSGGEPARGQLTAAQTGEVWTRVEALARDASLHVAARAKGTGAFEVTTGGETRRFIIAAGERLRELDAALAPYRLPAP